MFRATQEICREFTSKGIKHKAEEIGGKWIVNAGVSGDYINGVTMRFISSDNDSDVAFRVFSFVRVPESKKAVMLLKLNEVNKTYRYLKFYIDKDNEIAVEYDFPVTIKEPGPVAVEMFLRAGKILDIVYPELMNIIYA